MALIRAINSVTSTCVSAILLWEILAMQSDFTWASSFLPGRNGSWILA